MERILIIGCAIVSSDGFIADSDGGMDEIAHDHDFRLLQARLNAAPGVCLMGRVTDECHPNKSQRQRAVLSYGEGYDTRLVRRFHCADAFVRHAKAQQGPAYILGGGKIYQLFGQCQAYDEFHLSVRRDVILGDGRALGCNASAMTGWGLTLAAIHVDPSFPELEFRHYKK